MDRLVLATGLLLLTTPVVAGSPRPSSRLRAQVFAMTRDVGKALDDRAAARRLGKAVELASRFGFPQVRERVAALRSVAKTYSEFAADPVRYALRQGDRFSPNYSSVMRVMGKAGRTEVATATQYRQMLRWADSDMLQALRGRPEKTVGFARYYSALQQIAFSFSSGGHGLSGEDVAFDLGERPGTLRVRGSSYRFQDPQEMIRSMTGRPDLQVKVLSLRPGWKDGALHAATTFVAEVSPY